MQIYHYHPATLEYIGPGTADPSPLEPGVWLAPAYATMISPPESVAGKVRQFVNGAWVYSNVTEDPVDPEYEPSIEEIATAKLAAINNGKNTALDGGFTHNGILFDSDSKARLAYLEFGFKLNTAPTYSTHWKASAGQWVVMDATLFASLQPAYETHIQSCFIWQAMREQEVAAAVAANDITALKAVAETM